MTSKTPRTPTFHPAPADQAHDPRYAVPVSRQGLDHGAVQRDTEMVEVEDPHRENGVIVAQRVRSGLGRMLRRGDISTGMAEIGARFQRHFDVCGYCHVTTVNLGGVSGGGGGVEDALTRSMASRDIVNRLLFATGWPETLPGKAAWWVIGHGMGLEEIAQRRDLHSFAGETDSRYWKGAVVTALQMMEREWRGWQQAEARTGARKIRFQRHFKPEDLTVRGGVIPRP